MTATMEVPEAALVPQPIEGRTFVCRHCRHVVLADTTSGPLPTVCAVCDPEGALARRHKRQQSRDLARRKATRMRELEAENAELRAALALHDPLAIRARRLPGDVGRGQVGRMVALVTHAAGKKQTADALLNLAAAATAWARVLGVDVDE